MKPPDERRGELIAGAAFGALVDARWHTQDLISRRPKEATPDLLRGLARAMAFSPIARDQVLSVALLLAAEELERGGDVQGLAALAVLQRLEPAEAERLALRQEIFSAGAVPAAESHEVVASLERRYGPECRTPVELAGRLRDEAGLHELLWDHPRLPAAGRARLVMLFSVPKLLDRVRELEPRSAPAGSKPAAFKKGRRSGRKLGRLFAARG